jgi:hypothetical protein
MEMAIAAETRRVVAAVQNPQLSAKTVAVDWMIKQALNLGPTGRRSFGRGFISMEMAYKSGGRPEVLTKSMLQRSFGRVAVGRGTRNRLASFFRGLVRTSRPSWRTSRLPPSHSEQDPGRLRRPSSSGSMRHVFRFGRFRSTKGTEDRPQEH